MRYTPAKRVFDSFFDDMFPTYGNYTAYSLMRTDIREKDGRYYLDIDMPGFKKEDIKISLFNGNLTVSAEHHETTDEKDAKGNIVRQERYSGSVSRTWYVGSALRETDVHASFNDGTLTVEIPSEQKKQEEETKFIDIL